jgi:hypothetical protein
MHYAGNVAPGHNVTALGQGGANTGYRVRVSIQFIMLRVRYYNHPFSV